MTAIDCPVCGEPIRVKVTLTARATDQHDRRVVSGRAAVETHRCVGEWP